MKTPLRWLATLAVLIVVTLSGWLAWPQRPSQAIASAANQSMVSEVQVSLGTTDGALSFVPDRLDFTAGRRYKLVLSNPSPQKHYFTAKDFADGIWTQKVEAGNVEIKGAIHELELRPGTTAEWFFTPLKSGTFELRCSIPGHAEAGMTGTITIRS
ncbi:MAG TPA: plastocyanin/azurin family copper-binding protein [Chroococcidiopsis sp.]